MAIISMRARGSSPLAGSSSSSTLRIVNQHARQAEPLLHAAAQRADERALLFRQADQFQNIVDGFFALRGGNFVARAEEIEVLGHFHVLIHAEKIRHVTDDMAHGVGFADDIVAKDFGRAGGRREKSGEDAQRGGFARAIGADEAEQIAAVDGQVERIERGHAP